MKRLPVFALGVLLLLALVFYSKRVSPNEEKPESSPDVSKEVSKMSEGSSKGSSMFRSLQSGIESSRVANEEIAADHAKHHEDLIRQKELEEQKKAEEAAYWESRQEWIENFPFEPVHHPTITFDPNIYNPVGPGGPSDDTPEGEKMAKMIRNHGFLSAFYENPNRYSPEFEQINRILTEEGIEPDPIQWGWLFTHIGDYHKANQHDPEQPWPINPQKTWGYELELNANSILARMMSNKHRAKPFSNLPSEQEAIRIRDRLLNEIPADGFLNLGMGQDFSYNYHHEEQLKPGDPLLVH